MILVIVNAIVDTVIVFVVARRGLSRAMDKKLGIVPVDVDGEEIYTVAGVDGKPLKVPVMVEKDGKMVQEERYMPLAWCLPMITANYIKASFTGKIGGLKAQAEKFARGELPIEEAAQAMALDAFAKGKYGQALAAYILPSVVNAIRSNRVGLPGQKSGEGYAGSGRPTGEL